jgi:hypothetical protein
VEIERHSVASVEVRLNRIIEWLTFPEGERRGSFREIEVIRYCITHGGVADSRRSRAAIDVAPLILRLAIAGRSP